MKIALCSNNHDNRILKQWLRSFTESEGLSIFVFKGLEDLLHSYREQHYYDLIFLDWPLRRQAIQQLRTMDGQAKLVLLLKDEELVRPMFELGATAYLQKPLQKEATEQLFLRCREEFLRYNREVRFTVCSADGQKETITLSTREILYVTSYLRKIKIFTIYQQQYECYGRISELEDTLKEHRFFRAHKSYLVNLRYVCYIGVDKIGLIHESGAQILTLPLARRKRDLMKEAVQQIECGQKF